MEVAVSQTVTVLHVSRLRDVAVSQTVSALEKRRSVLLSVDMKDWSLNGQKTRQQGRCKPTATTRSWFHTNLAEP